MSTYVSLPLPRTLYPGEKQIITRPHAPHHAHRHMSQCATRAEDTNAISQALVKRASAKDSSSASDIAPSPAGVVRRRQSSTLPGL